tara:strand:+ start:7788 stop:8564 length:777 start_codon:yes stop_codon:yes gene_type:complete
MINVFINILKNKNFFVILKKIFKRFEKDTSIEAEKWAKSNTYQTTEEFCRLIDSSLYEEIKPEINSLEEYAENKLLNLSVKLGGSGNYKLLYFLIRKIKPTNVVETGVAAGWTSLAILRALKKNGKGFLYSSDFPYFRLKNPEQYIGYLAKDEINKKDWFLDIRGDDIALSEIMKQLNSNSIDLFHYDSDKSYTGKTNAIEILKSKISSKTIIIFDDIQNNFHFRDFVEKNQKTFRILKFQGKYLGILNYEVLFNQGN